MTKLCRACEGPVCPDCGGCIREGECSCVADISQDVITLHRENEHLRTLLREIASFMEADPPDLRPRRREWQAERDAFVERAREAL